MIDLTDSTEAEEIAHYLNIPPEHKHFQSFLTLALILNALIQDEIDLDETIDYDVINALAELAAKLYGDKMYGNESEEDEEDSSPKQGNLFEEPLDEWN